IETPPTVTDTDAFAVTLPADGDVKITVHWLLTVPALAQLSVTFVKPAPLLLVNVTAGFVPSATLTKPRPSPAFCFTVTVIVCGALTSLVAVGGEIAMFRSTNVLVAGPEPFGPLPMLAVAGSVSRVSD